MSVSDGSGKWITRSDRLRDLLAQARKQRSARRRSNAKIFVDTQNSTRECSVEVSLAKEIERMLSGALPGTVCSEMYLSQLITYFQLASDTIDTVMTSVQSIPLAPFRARALGVLIHGLLYFLEASVKENGRMDVYLAMAIDDGVIVVGLAAEGDVQCLATAEATAAMRRSAEIVSLLGGGFQRGIDGTRQILGITFPLEFSEALA